MRNIGNEQALRASFKCSSEPLKNSVHTFAERADYLGYLGRDGYSLDGIFYHENISVTSNEENHNG